MTQPHLIILDLDRTAFDTERFVEDLIAAMAAEFNLDPHIYKSQMKDYSRPNEIGYDFYAHAHVVTGQAAEAIKAAMLRRLAATDYAYPDIAPWLSRQTSAGIKVVVVTVGKDDYQELKFASAKTLSGLQRIVVEENKGRLLCAALSHNPPNYLGALDISGQELTVIDDNPLTFQELSSMLHIHQFYLSRPHGRFAGQTAPAHVTVITSFGDLT